MGYFIARPAGRIRKCRFVRIPFCRGEFIEMSRKRSPKERPEHDSNAEPSKREKHQKGQRRKKMGQGKDRKRQKPDWFQR
jgi:hypothetical protein